MAKEYYVIKSVTPKDDHRRAWQLLKYSTTRVISGQGHVYETQDGKFVSDDRGFKSHQNELASRRIRIVKKHLELEEPRFAAYWFNKNNIECFKV